MSTLTAFKLHLISSQVLIQSKDWPLCFLQAFDKGLRPLPNAFNLGLRPKIKNLARGSPFWFRGGGSIEEPQGEGCLLPFQLQFAAASCTLAHVWWGGYQKLNYKKLTQQSGPQLNCHNGKVQMMSLNGSRQQQTNNNTSSSSLTLKVIIQA